MAKSRRYYIDGNTVRVRETLPARREEEEILRVSVQPEQRPVRPAVVDRRAVGQYIIMKEGQLLELLRDAAEDTPRGHHRLDPARRRLPQGEEVFGRDAFVVPQQRAVEIESNDFVSCSVHTRIMPQMQRFGKPCFHRGRSRFSPESPPLRGESARGAAARPGGQGPAPTPFEPQKGVFFRPSCIKNRYGGIQICLNVKKLHFPLAIRRQIVYYGITA